MYPQIECKRLAFKNHEALHQILRENADVIPHGNGRSYGDSSLNDTIVDVRHRDYFIDFDEKIGLLHIQAGVLLSEILEHFLPRGWFLKITPGTKLITVGGAIASDVHGKNHHVAGCFSESVKKFNLMLPDGKIVACSKEKTPDLFRATCGGQGLTGVILDAQIYLQKVNSNFIDQTIIKTKNLRETFEAFEAHSNATYSVAWIDCLAKGKARGRSLLMLGDFSEKSNAKYQPTNQINLPINLPSLALNKFSIKAFNWLYYNRISSKFTNHPVNIDSFFYPLDTIGNWNRIYGKNGFTQYQFIMPKQTSYHGLEEMLGTIAESRKGSFLAVLKLYGKANQNWLSFPMEGYSLALDFRIEKGILELLDSLDKILVKQRGRIYLSKDVRVSKEIFEQGYPQIEKFRKYRKANKMDEKFQSLQSKRLGI
jgi:FAD/FMN-containing dehydrogenase